ncbi:MAG: right-handed parallel beta-helix repeat-containing protein, partial [Acidimicrobiales bacterium]
GVELAPGRHDPFTLTAPATVRGRPGAVVGGGVEVRADGARLVDLEVVGGEGGVLVRGADGVVLDGVTVRGAAFHGIEVVDASVAVRGCTVTGLTSPYGQGVEVRNAKGRSPTTVAGCAVSGRQEGVVAHLSRVELRGNRVEGTALRGIAVTEMSEGLVAGNTVTGVTGVGLYCGDMSRCEMRDNVVRGVRPDPRGVRSRAGQAVVAWYHSTMRVEGNRLDAAPGAEPVAALQGSTLVDHSPLSPRPPGWPGVLPALPVAAAAVGGLALLSAAVGRALSRRDGWGPAPRPAGPTPRLLVVAVVGGLAVQGFHLLEHGVQVWQTYAAWADQRSGLLGARADTEWVHLAFNLVVLAFLALTWRAARRPRLLVGPGAAWLAAAIAVQGYHVVEHVAKVAQHELGGVATAPGLVGARVGLAWFHLGVNLAVTVGTAVVVAALLGAHRAPASVAGGGGGLHPEAVRPAPAPAPT